MQDENNTEKWFHKFFCIKITSVHLHLDVLALCSINYQNVKLRLDLVEIWKFSCHSDFTWNQLLANSNGPKMSFLTISKVLNFEFSKFEQLSSPNLPKIQSSESPMTSVLPKPKLRWITKTGNYWKIWSKVNWKLNKILIFFQNFLNHKFQLISSI